MPRTAWDQEVAVLGQPAMDPRRHRRPQGLVALRLLVGPGHLPLEVPEVPLVVHQRPCLQQKPPRILEMVVSEEEAAKTLAPGLYVPEAKPVPWEPWVLWSSATYPLNYLQHLQSALLLRMALCQSRSRPELAVESPSPTISIQLMVALPGRLDPLFPHHLR